MILYGQYWNGRVTEMSLKAFFLEGITRSWVAILDGEGGLLRLIKGIRCLLIMALSLTLMALINTL